MIKKGDRQQRKSGVGSYPTVTLLRHQLQLRLNLNVSSSSGKNSLLRGSSSELQLQHPAFNYGIYLDKFSQEACEACSVFDCERFSIVFSFLYVPLNPDEVPAAAQSSLKKITRIIITYQNRYFCKSFYGIL